jgi:hypothetical protein
VPVFEIRPISFVEGIGLMLLLTFAKSKGSYKKETITAISITNDLFVSVGSYTLTLFIGWLIHSLFL